MCLWTISYTVESETTSISFTGIWSGRFGLLEVKNLWSLILSFFYDVHTTGRTTKGGMGHLSLKSLRTETYEISDNTPYNMVFKSWGYKITLIYDIDTGSQPNIFTEGHNLSISNFYP